MVCVSSPVYIVSAAGRARPHSASPRDGSIRWQRGKSWRLGLGGQEHPRLSQCCALKAAQREAERRRTFPRCSIEGHDTKERVVIPPVLTALCSFPGDFYAHPFGVCSDFVKHREWELVLPGLSKRKRGFKRLHDPHVISQSVKGRPGRLSKPNLAVSPCTSPFLAPQIPLFGGC